MISTYKIFIVVCVPSIFVSCAPLVTFNDDVIKTTPEMIADQGYPAETHWVTTPDGYILCLHRIPTGRNGETNNKVAFIMHALLTSSADYVLFGPGKSLAYILADEGYDVWMANARGNIYSRNHTTYNPDKDADFWKFSWNEIGEIDLPTSIDYVLDNTGVDGVYYTGHSQGTTSFFVMTSGKPEYNQKIKVQASLAPVAYMEHMKSPFPKFFSQFQDKIEKTFNELGIHEFMPGKGEIQKTTMEFCKLAPLVCENILFAICGFSFAEMNSTALPLMMGHIPAGASIMQIYHYNQEMNSGKFRKYDYGETQNLEVYGATSPPDYDLKKITAPVFLFYAKVDWFAAVEDVEKLYGELGNPAGKMIIGDDTFNHIDFVYGTKAPELVYTNILNLFNEY